MTTDQRAIEEMAIADVEHHEEDDYNDDIIQDYKYKKGVLTAMRDFRAYKTYKEDVTIEQRFDRMVWLIKELSTIYGMETPVVEMENIDGSDSGESSYSPMEHKIVLRGKLSIITLLHEFAHARGMGEEKARIWSVNLFRRVYPKQFEKLHRVGVMFVS